MRPAASPIAARRSGRSSGPTGFRFQCVGKRSGRSKGARNARHCWVSDCCIHAALQRSGRSAVLAYAGSRARKLPFGWDGEGAPLKGAPLSLNPDITGGLNGR